MQVRSMSLQTPHIGLAPLHLVLRARQESQARAVRCLLGFRSPLASNGGSSGAERGMAGYSQDGLGGGACVR